MCPVPSLLWAKTRLFYTRKVDTVLVATHKASVPLHWRIDVPLDLDAHDLHIHHEVPMTPAIA
jgi:hypothetical protein